MIGPSASKNKRFKIRGHQHSGRTKSFGNFRTHVVEQSGDRVEDDAVFGDKNMQTGANWDQDNKLTSLENSETYFSMKAGHTPRTTRHTSRENLLSNRLNELSALSNTKRAPSHGFNEFYLTQLTHRAKPKLMHSSTINVTDLRLLMNRKDSQESLLYKAQNEFDENLKQKVGEQILLPFPMDVRAFFESQTSKNKTTLRKQLLDFERSMHCFAEVEQNVTAYKPHLGLMCSTVAAEFRQHWMGIIGAMINIIRHQEELEAKARENIMHGHKADNKEKTMLKLQVASLQEMLSFKETQIDLLQANVQDKERKIADLREAKNTIHALVRHSSPENEASERLECLSRLTSIQTDIQKLTSQYEKIEDEKKAQELSMMQMRVLTRENILTGPKEKGIQVEEVGQSDSV